MKDDKIPDRAGKRPQTAHKCPKCGKKYYDYSALSRDDNKTEICPECGLKEALTIWANFE